MLSLSISQIIKDVKSGAISIDLKLPDSFTNKVTYEKEITKSVIDNLSWYFDRGNSTIDSLPMVIKASHGFLDPISGVEYMLVMFEPNRISIGNFGDGDDIIEAPTHDKSLVVDDFIECVIDVPSGYLAIGGEGLSKVMVNTIEGYKEHYYDNDFQGSLAAAKKHIDLVNKENVFHVPSGAYAAYYKKGKQLILASQAIDDLVMDYDIDTDALGTKLKDAKYSDSSYSLIICDRNQALTKAQAQGVDIKKMMDVIKVAAGTYKVKYLLKRTNPEDVVYCYIDMV
jgi:hypothetical protein